MPSEPARLSKSRYLSGLQCHKQLWWRVHEPEAPELSPSPGEQNRFAQGREVGEHARGHVPGGELIDLPYYQYDNKVAATREALNRGLPAIYEAWFLADETYVGVDILERASRGYTVIEVKASNSRKPEHLPDATVQVHVLRRAGLQVERAELMHLNSQCRYPDLSNLFVREDVTALVEAALIGVPDELAAQQRMLEGPLPDVAIGEHCTTPHDCPFIERCWPKLPDHHVSKLYRIELKRALELEADGYATIYDLPSDLELSVIHARQVQAVQTGRMVVEPSLTKALAQFVSPLAFLDFETVSLAIPRWPGCRPARDRKAHRLEIEKRERRHELSERLRERRLHHHPPRLHRLHLTRVDHRQLQVRGQVVDRRVPVGFELERSLALDAVQFADVVIGELGPAALDEWTVVRRRAMLADGHVGQRPFEHPLLCRELVRHADQRRLDQRGDVLTHEQVG